MALAPHNNALAWAHFRLRGGFTRSLWFTGAAMLGLGILIIITSRLANDGGRTLFGWVVGCLGFGTASLLLFAPIRISGIIRKDIDSKMIESHRLMPLPPGHAIAGYIFGAAAPGIIFFAGLWLLGGITASAAGVSAVRWTFACGVLLAFSAFIFVLCAYACFGAKLGAGMVFIPLIALYMTQGGFLALLPGLTVLLSPIMGQSIFDLRGNGFMLPGTYAISFAAQAFFSAICFIAAARKYRRADAIGIDTILGLCVVAGWAGASAVGLRAWEDFRPRWSFIHAPMNVQIIASLIIGVLFSLVTITANARERIRWRWHERIKDPAPMARPIPFAAVIAVCTFLIILIPFGAKYPVPVHAHGYIRSAIAIALALTSVYFLTESLYLVGWKAAAPIFGWMILLWIAPILVDLLRFSLGDYGESERLSGFTTISPVGTIALTWMESMITCLPGLLVQGFLTAVMLAIWIMLRRRRGVALPV